MIRVGLIGFGYSAQTFHLPFLLQHSAFELSAVVSSKPELVKEKVPGAVCYSTLGHLLDDDHCDLVIITAPNDLHYGMAHTCLEAEKHVLVEKPFVIRSEEAETLVRLAQAKNRVLSVYQNRRYDGDFLSLQALIQSKRLGPIRYMASHFDRFRPEIKMRWRELGGPGGGIWYDLGPHLIDQAFQLFGFPKEVSGHCRAIRPGGPAADYFHVLLHYSDKEVVLQSSPYCAGETMRFDVQGEKGRYVKYGLDPQEAILKQGMLPDTPEWIAANKDKPGELFDENGQASPWSTIEGNYLQFFNELEKAILGESNAVTDLTTVIEALRIIEKISAKS